MKPVAEIFYDALKADADVVAQTGDRIFDNCIEIPPTDTDNTPLPYVIVADDGFTNNLASKDCVWEGTSDNVTVGIEVSAKSSGQLADVVKLVRQAIGRYIADMARDCKPVPELDSLEGSPVNWDWTKPCYYQRLTYKCII